MAQKMARMRCRPTRCRRRDLGKKNESPDFKGDKVERSVAETAEVGDDVPGPVVATVFAPSSTDILTYGLRAVVLSADLDTDDIIPDGVTPFQPTRPPLPTPTLPPSTSTRRRDRSRWRKSWTSRAEALRATGTGNTSWSPRSRTPATWATSSWWSSRPEDINEDPVLSGRPELTINEIDSGAANADSPLFVGNTANDAPTVNVYGVVDEDRRAATNEWSLEGEDKDQFQLIGNVGRTLVFRNQPDYETPADADGDNVYKVTVVTLDGDGGRAEFDVCIAVMNVNEDRKDNAAR